MPRLTLLRTAAVVSLMIASSAQAQSLVLSNPPIPRFGFFPRPSNSLLVVSRPQTARSLQDPARLAIFRNNPAGFAIFDPQVSPGTGVFTPGGVFDPASTPGEPALGAPFDPAGGIGATPATFDPQSSDSSGITFDPVDPIIVTGTLDLDPLVGGGLFTAGGGIGLSPTAPLRPGFSVSPFTTGFNTFQSAGLDAGRIGGTGFGATGFTPTGTIGSARFSATANPEPATALLLGLATAGATLAATRRRRPHGA